MERRYNGQGRASRYFVSTPISQRSMLSRTSEITTPEYVNPLNLKLDEINEFENEQDCKENETKLNKTNLRSRFFTSGKDGDNNDASPRQSSSNNCAICLETISRDSRCKPVECCHEFCLECLLEWTQISNACPLCKQVMSEILELTTTKKHVVIRPQKEGSEDEFASDEEDQSRPYLSDGTDLSGFIVSDREIESEEEELSLSENDDESGLSFRETPLARPRRRRRIYQSDSEST